MSTLAATANQPSALLHVTQALELAVCVAAVAVLAVPGRTRPGASRWALAMFGDLGLIVLLGQFPVDDDGSLLRHGYTVALLCVLLLVPYLLVRFALSLGAISRTGHRVAVALTVLQLGLTVVSPEFPTGDEPRSTWFTAYVVVILVGWTTQSVLSAVGLWSAGRGQPSVVRRRMQVLSIGAVVVALTLVASGGSADPSTPVQVVTAITGALGIGLLVLAFVVPPWLATAWRSADLVRLGSAERALMTAVSPEDVGAAIVPAVMHLLGAGGAALLDGQGRTIVAEGSAGEAPTGDELPDGAVVHTADGGFACRLTDGWLVVRPGAFAPLFGTAELQLMDRVGSFTDLALQRCRLFEEQARARRATEVTNAELQTLIYSVSHDLRNPIISVLGYLDVLAREHAGQLQGEGGHYLERISVNALYMQNLIQDLLELSRIGRSEPPSQAVALGALAESVAEELRALHPECTISVEGSFPVAWMSELRARQLLTNLIENAAKYRRDGANVNVRAHRGEPCGTVLTVTDDGMGIPEHLREKAFDVFERLGAAHSDVPGTGMGLPICKRIIETLGGTITLKGPPPEQETGTTVNVELPESAVLGWAPVPAAEKEHAT
jgi:signal transduction histidine kinase